MATTVKKLWLTSTDKEAGGWKIEPSCLNDLKSDWLKRFSADENSSETYADAIKNFQSRHV
jgi:hypothetical protein